MQERKAVSNQQSCHPHPVADGQASTAPQNRQEGVQDAGTLLYEVYGTYVGCQGKSRKIGGMWMPDFLSDIKSLAARILYSELLFRERMDRERPRSTFSPKRTLVSQSELRQACGLNRDQTIQGLTKLTAAKLITVKKVMYCYRWVSSYELHPRFNERMMTSPKKGVFVPGSLFFVKDLPARLLLAQLVYWVKGFFSKGLIAPQSAWGIRKSLSQMNRVTALSKKQVQRALNVLKRMGIVYTSCVKYKVCH